jgi:hypothetical protein
MLLNRQNAHSSPPASEQPIRSPHNSTEAGTPARRGLRRVHLQTVVGAGPAVETAAILRFAGVHRRPVRTGSARNTPPRVGYTPIRSPAKNHKCTPSGPATPVQLVLVKAEEMAQLMDQRTTHLAPQFNLGTRQALQRHAE